MHRRFVTFGLAVLIIAAFAAPAEAQRKPEDVFGGQIVTSDKKFPTQAASSKQFIDKVRKQKKDKFWEDKENKRWRVHFAAFFKKPLNDLEVTVKLYDVSGNQRRMVASFEQYLDARGQRSIISSVKLDRKDFGVNRQILMVMENRGKVLASGKFKILGEAERFSGKVEFSEEEAARGSSD